MSPMPPMGNGENDRRTPRELFDRYDREHRFTLDGAASHANTLVPSYYATEEGTFSRIGETTVPVWPEDGLRLSWSGERVWLNPPYGRGLLEPFVRKACLEMLIGDATVVALLPVRTDQRWFHEFVLPGLASQHVRIDYLQGRVRFGGASAGAPFPSMVVTWQPSPWLGRVRWGRRGITEITTTLGATTITPRFAG